MYHFAARASAFAMSLVSAWLTPTVSYRNRAMLTEVLTRALEVRDQDMVCGSTDKSLSESSNSPRPWDIYAGLAASNSPRP